MASSEGFRPALIVVDMQNDFSPPDGSLAVPGARDLAPIINGLLDLPFVVKLGTQDWHPQDHISFASNHPPPNNKPLSSYVTLQNPRPEKDRAAGEHGEMEQRLWPDHCIQGSKGADIIQELNQDKITDGFVKKGMKQDIEMYSVFASSFVTDPSYCHSIAAVTEDVGAVLKSRRITHVFTVGVAGDYCVKFTALDAARCGFKTYVIREGTKYIEPDSENEISQEYQKLSVQIIGLDGEEVQKVKALAST